MQPFFCDAGSNQGPFWNEDRTGDQIAATGHFVVSHATLRAVATPLSFFFASALAIGPFAGYSRRTEESVVRFSLRAVRLRSFLLARIFHSYARVRM